MQRDLVETRGWVTEAEYKQALALAQLAPGPLAAQVAIYLGWLRAGVAGATLVGVAFVAPSFLMVLAIAVVYTRYGGLPWMQGAFYGIGATVIAVIARSAVRLVKLTLRRDALLWAVFLGNAAAVAVTQSEIIWLFLASGVAVLLARGGLGGGPSAAVLGVMLPAWLAGGSADAGALGKLFWFFAKAGAVVFGSGLAIVPFLYGGAVGQHHWLTEREFLDAVAVSMITPGPVVITVAFIGFLVAGLAGAVVASVGVFLPTWLAVVIVAPSFNRMVANPRVKAFVEGVTAAATGAIAGAALVLGRRAIVDWPTLGIATGVLAVLTFSKGIGEIWLILGAGGLGVMLHGLPLAGVARPAPSQQPARVLRTVAQVPLPGPAVRFDYQSIDTVTDRLYIAHMNAGHLVVVDLAARAVVANLAGFDQVHGVIAVPAVRRVYASVTGRHQVAVVDAPSLRVLARVGGILYPDGLAYAPATDRLFVSDERGEAVAVIDARTNRLVTSIPLGGEAGNTVYDPASRTILVAVHGKHELVTIDPATATVVWRTPLPGVRDPHGIALDVARRIAFVAGEGSATMAVVDLTRMEVSETVKVGAAPDVLAFDPVWGRLYVATESGLLSVFTEVDRNGRTRLSHDGDLSLPRAHTVSVDSRTHLVYLPLENVRGRPVLRIMAGAPPGVGAR